MNFSSEPIFEPDPLPPIHNRRKRSFLPSLSTDDRSEFIQELAHRVEPTFDFFLFSLLAGAVMAAGWLFHAPAILIVGALLVPFMAPVVGLSLSTAIGSFRFLIISFAGLLVGVFLIFITGLTAGLASPIFAEYTMDVSYQIGNLPWDMLFAYLVGIGLTCLSLIKSEQTPALPSAILSYALLTRVSAAGYELGKGNIELALWQAEVMGILVLAGIVVGMIIFWGFAFRPAQGSAYILAFTWIIVLALVGWKAAYPAVMHSFELANSDSPGMAAPASATPLKTLTATQTLLPSQTSTVTSTSTPERKASETSTPSTLTPGNTPTSEIPFDWGFVAADGQSGARLRDKPSFSGKVIRILDNNLMIKILPGFEFKDKVYWSQVQLVDGTIGWMVRSVLITATPIPTEAFTPTP